MMETAIKILGAAFAYYLIWTVLLSIFPRPTAQERALEDAEFVAQMAKRRSGQP